MNMKSNKDNIEEDDFSTLFDFESKEEQIDHKAHMFMFRCLSEIERITGGLPKKEISKLVETSPSYITQLFRGDKLINLLMLARFELALDSEFEVVLRKNSEKKTEINNTKEPTIYSAYTIPADEYEKLSKDSSMVQPNTRIILMPNQPVYGNAS